MPEPMRQQHYNEIVQGLDKAMKVFLELTPTEQQAHDMMKDFVAKHYLPVWCSVSERERQDG